METLKQLKNIATVLIIMKRCRLCPVFSTVFLAFVVISRGQNLVLPDPVALYPLNEQYNTKDISQGKNPPGKAIGVKLAPGIYGQPAGSYSFKGSSTSFIEFSNNGGLDARFSMTFTAWIKPESSSGPLLTYTFNNKDGVRVWLASPDKLMAKFEIRDTRSLPYAIESGKIRLRSWNYIAASYDNSAEAMKLWIDGREVKSFKVGKFEIATQGDLRIGAATGGSNFFKGEIACVQIYNKSLTEQEMNAVRDRCPVRVQSQHIGCYGDKAANVIPSLEGKDPLLDGEPKSRRDAVQKCARVALKQGYAYFAIQDGGNCHSSLTAQDTYNMYGLSSNCNLGKGGKMASDVYEVIMFRDQTCWHGWDAKEGSCFKLYDEKKTWDDSQASCEAQRGALAKLNTEDKNYFVFLHLVKPASPSSSVWIGLSLDSNNNFYWSDGALVEYSNWGLGSPDTSPGNSKNCTKLNDVSGLWEDSDFDFTHPYVCERVVPESPREIFVKLMDSHSVLVMWTTTKQQAVTSYYVEYRLMNSDGVQLKVLQNQNKTSLTGLQSHAVYEVRVRAVNGAGGGIWSNYQTFSTGQTYSPQINPLSSVRTYVPGNNLVLNCTAQGGPDPTITWYKDRKLIHRGQRLVLGNDTSAPGVYTCRASNGIPPDDIAVVTVRFMTSPVLKNVWGTGQQAELSVKKGDPLSLQCETENTRDAKVTWYKDDEPLSAQWHFSKTVINIKEMSAEDFGVYKCKVENFLGVKSGKIKVINAETPTHLKFAIVGLAALSFILLVVIALLVCLLLKARRSKASESKDEPEDDPLPTLAGPRPSDHDIRVPEVKHTESTGPSPAGGNKSSYMPLDTDDTPNGGTSITFQATSF